MREQVWIIRNKVTGAHWQSSSGKGSWCKSGHAKNAWSLKNFRRKFDDQDAWEAVELITEFQELVGYMKHFITEASPQLSGSAKELGELYLKALDE